VKLRHWLLGVLCLAIQCWFLQAKAQGIWFERAEVAVNFGSGWVDQGPQNLAWRWDAHFPRQAGQAQLLLEFDRNDPRLGHASDLALVGVALGDRYRYSLNGEAWNEYGWHAASSHSRTSPQMLRLHPLHLREGVNHLVIQIQAEPANESGFSKLYLDEESVAQQEHQDIRDVRIISVIIVAAICVFTGLMALMLWGVHRGETFFYLGLAEVCFAGRQLATLVEHPPLPTWVWNLFMALGFALYVGFVGRASVYLTPKPKQWCLSINKAYLWCSVIVLTVGFHLGRADFYRAWGAVMILLTIVHTGYLVGATWRGKDLAPKVFAVAGVGALILGAWDFVFIRLLSDGLGRWRMATYGSVLFNIALTWIVIQRYSQSQRDLTLSKLQTIAEAEQAKRDERQRIMAELHDNVGAQLVGIQSMLTAKQAHDDVNSQVSTALDQLRMTVDALQPVHGRMEVVLASWRHRLQPRIAAAGLKLLWRVDQMPPVGDLSPQKIQHLQRILNEAVNIIRHAQAQTLEITARYEPANQDHTGRFVIAVMDDGDGFDPLAGHGQGLRNMHARATQLGGSIVELVIPQS
jgi:signal transduction histidine kinase